MLTARAWTLQQFDATFLSGLGLGDGTKDVFQFNLPPGQSLVSHTSGQMIDLVSFQVSNMPITGEMRIMLNTNPIAQGAGGVLDSFYNSNIDGTTTQDYYSGLSSGMESFSFATLGIETLAINDFSVNVYPNPATEYITISASKTIDKIEVYDMLGKLAIRGNNTNTIHINHLQNGVYLMKIYSGDTSITKKIVKD